MAYIGPSAGSHPPHDSFDVITLAPTHDVDLPVALSSPLPSPPSAPATMDPTDTSSVTQKMLSAVSGSILTSLLGAHALPAPVHLVHPLTSAQSPLSTLCVSACKLNPVRPPSMLPPNPPSWPFRQTSASLPAVERFTGSPTRVNSA